AIANDDYVLDLPHLTTGIKAVDFIAVHNIYWYQTQLWRMAKNKRPKPDMSPWRSFATTMANNGRHAFRKLRA
ncbi:MAG: NADH oxidase, partial [Nevskiales bacterium]